MVDGWHDIFLCQILCWSKLGFFKCGRICPTLTPSPPHVDPCTRAGPQQVGAWFGMWEWEFLSRSLVTMAGTTSAPPALTPTPSSAPPGVRPRIRIWLRWGLKGVSLLKSCWVFCLAWSFFCWSKHDCTWHSSSIGLLACDQFLHSGRTRMH